MSTEQFTELKNEIVSRLTKNFNIKEIILFGSYAYGNPTKDSDIDLVLILNERGFAKDFEEMLQRRLKIAEYLYEFRKTTPIDFFAYTEDEWKRLIEVDSFFIREINTRGVRIV